MCSAACRSEFCGDSVVQNMLGESCDDGGLGGCRPDCMLVDASCTYTQCGQNCCIHGCSDGVNCDPAPSGTSTSGGTQAQNGSSSSGGSGSSQPFTPEAITTQAVLKLLASDINGLNVAANNSIQSTQWKNLNSYQLFGDLINFVFGGQALDNSTPESGWTGNTKKHPSALQCDSYDDSVLFPTSNIFNTTSNLSITAWIKFDGRKNTYEIIQKASWTSGYQLRIDSVYDPTTGAYVPNLRFLITGQSTTDIIDSGLITPGQWHYVAVVYNTTDTGQALSIYVDGNLRNTKDTNIILENISSPVSLCKRLDTGLGDISKGSLYLSSVQVYNTKLNSSQIRGDYLNTISYYHPYKSTLSLDTKNVKNSNPATPASSTLTTQIWSDINGYPNNDGTLYYFASPPKPESGWDTNVLKFDGNNDFIKLPDNAFEHFPTTSFSTPFYTTISIWFKTKKYGVLLGQTTAANLPPTIPEGYRPLIYLNNKGKIKTNFAPDPYINPYEPQPPEKKSYNDNQWHNIVLTYNDSKEILYVDGKEESVKNGGFPPFSNKYNYLLGTGYTADYPGTNNKWFPYKGHLAKFTVYDYELNIEQVKSNYNSEVISFPQDTTSQSNTTTHGDICDFPNGDEYNFQVLDYYGNPTGQISNPCRECLAQFDGQSDCYKCSYCQGTGACRMPSCDSCCHAEDIPDDERLIIYLDAAMLQPDYYNQYNNPNGGPNYGGANYGGANYGGTNYGGANYGGANYGGANYGGANYGGANYGGANYGGANYGGANTGNATFGGGGRTVRWKSTNIYKNYFNQVVPPPSPGYNGNNNPGYPGPDTNPNSNSSGNPSYPGTPTPPASYPGLPSGNPDPANPGSYPGALPGSYPGALPGANPGSYPGALPGSYPGALPGSYPGALPGSYPGALPGSYPGAPTLPGNDPNYQGSQHQGQIDKTEDWYNLGNFDQFLSSDSYLNGQIFKLVNFDFGANSGWGGKGIPKEPYYALFDGVNDHIVLPGISTFGLKATNSFTVEFIFNANDARVGDDILYYVGRSDLVDPSQPSYTHSLVLDYTGNIIVHGENTRVKVKPNTWYHVLYTKDEVNNSELYLNGNKVWVGRATTIAPASIPTVGYLGGRYFQGALRDFYRGKIALFKLYKVALNDSEVAKVYNEIDSALKTANGNTSASSSSVSPLGSTLSCGVNLDQNYTLQSKNPLQFKVKCDGYGTDYSVDPYIFSPGTPTCNSSGIPTCSDAAEPTKDYYGNPLPTIDAVGNPIPKFKIDCTAPQSGLPSCCKTYKVNNENYAYYMEYYPDYDYPEFRDNTICNNNAVFCKLPKRPPLTISATVKILNELDIPLGKGAVILTDKSGQEYDANITGSDKVFGTYFTLLSLNGLATIINDRNPLKGAQGTTNLIDEKYHTIVATIDGDNVSIYVDGNLEGTNNYNGSVSAPPSTPSVFYYPTNVSDYNYLLFTNKSLWNYHRANISINQIKFYYPKALTSDEVSAETKSPTEIPEKLRPYNIAFWRLFENKETNDIKGYRYYNEIVNEYPDNELTITNNGAYSSISSNCEVLPRAATTNLLLSLDANNIDGMNTKAPIASINMTTTWTDISSTLGENTCTLANYSWDESSNWTGNGNSEDPFSLSFNGTNTYVEKVNPLRLTNNIGAIEFWVKVDDFMSHNQLLTYILSLSEEGTDNSFGIFTGFPNRNRFGFKLQGKNQNGENEVFLLASTKSEFETGKWYHLAYISDRNNDYTLGQQIRPNYKLYINGKEVELNGSPQKYGYDEFTSRVNLYDVNNTLFFNYLKGNLLRIGNLKLSKPDPNTGKRDNFHFEGQIANLRIYGVPLSQKEVLDHYNADVYNFPKNETGSIIQGVSTLDDLTPPGIKLQPAPPEGLTYGDPLNIDIEETGLALPEGDNPTTQIKDVKCTLKNKELINPKIKEVKDFKSGIKFDPKYNQKIKTSFPDEELREWTIEALVKRTNPPSRVFETILRGKGYGLYLTQAYGNNAYVRLGKLYDDVINNSSTIYGSTPIQPDKWYLITITCNGAETHLYINGDEDPTSASYLFNSIKFNFGNLTIGGEDSYITKECIAGDARGWYHTNPNYNPTYDDPNYDPNYYIYEEKPKDYPDYAWSRQYGNKTFPGSIGQVRIYKRALAEKEVKNNARYRVEPNDPNGLIGWWVPTRTTGSIIRGYKWNLKQGITVDPTISGTLAGFSQDDCDIFKTINPKTDVFNTYGLDDSCRSCLTTLQNRNPDTTPCEKCNECSRLCGYKTCDFCCGKKDIGQSTYTYTGRAQEYSYNIRRYTYAIPTFTKTPDKYFPLSCFVSDKSFNQSEDSLGSVLILQNLLKAGTSSGSIKGVSSSGGDSKISKPGDTSCCKCSFGVLRCKNGTTLTCTDKRGKEGIPGCTESTEESTNTFKSNEFICCAKDQILSATYACLGQDAAIFQCLQSSDFITKSTSTSGSTGKTEIGKTETGKTGKKGNSSNSPTTINTIIASTPQTTFTQDDNNLIDAVDEIGEIEGLDEEFVLPDGSIDTEAFSDKNVSSNKNEKGESKFFKKVACAENVGNFVVKGYDFFTGESANYKYSTSKLSIYKVNFDQGKNGRTKIDLDLVTEVENNEQLREECTQPVQAAVAGTIVFNKDTKELVVADANGTNIGQVFKVNFKDDSKDSSVSDLTLNYKGKLNISSVYDGYISDAVITPNYGKSYYLFFAKANEKNYNHDILIFPIVDDPNKVFSKAGNKKEQSLIGGKKGQNGDVSASNQTGGFLLGSGQQILIGGGGGIGGATQANPFGDTKQDSSTDNQAKDQSQTQKTEEKKPEEKPKEQENNSSGSIKPSSTSSGGKSENNSSGGNKAQDCKTSDDCTNGQGLLALSNLFCIEVNNHGQCIDPSIISPSSKIRKNKCLANELEIKGRSPKEKLCVPLKSGQNNSNPDSPKANVKPRIQENPENKPEIHSPESNNRDGPNENLNKAYLPPSSRFFFQGQEETSLRDIDGSQFGPYDKLQLNNIINVQDAVAPPPKDNSCKNFVDCDTSQGYFCLNSQTGNTTGESTKGICSYVCKDGKVATGLDLNGDSLPCPSGFYGCSIKDLSGREICCVSQSDCPSTNHETQETSQTIPTCNSSKDCDKGEYCIEIQPNVRGCAPFNKKIIRVSFACKPTEIILAQATEGFLCSGLDEVKDKDQDQDKDKEKDKEESSSSSSSSGGSTSSSSGGSSSSSGSTSSSSGSSKNTSSSSSGGKSSSSSGGTKKQSSSGAPPDYQILLALQTPEVFTAKTFSLEDIKKGTQADNYHNYYSGDNVSFTVSVLGPSDAKPQDLKSYSLLVTSKEKSGSSRDSSNNADLKPLAISVEDIIASSDIVGFSSNAPPLNISLARESDKGSITAASGGSFKLTFPDFRYLSNDAGGLRLVRPDSGTVLVQENKCKSDNICGTDSIGFTSCVAYRCWRFSKGSDCCKGVFEGVEDAVGSSSSSGGSSGAPDVPKPTCNKDTKNIECKSKNAIYLTYCKNREIPFCDDGKPACKSPTSPPKKSKNESGSSSGDIPPPDETDTDSAPKNEPVCLSLKEHTQTYCNDISSLIATDRFDPSSCVSEYCSFIQLKEDKRSCCAACGTIYDKLSPSNSSNNSSSSSGSAFIDLGEEDSIKSCLDINGGYCGQFKSAEICVKEKCYQYDTGSDELQACCLKYDKEASRVSQLLKEVHTDDSGKVYNIVTINKGEGDKTIKVQKREDLIAQKFELALPSDEQLENIIIKAAIQDKKGKTKEAELKIKIIPAEIKQDEPAIAEETGDKPPKASLAEGGKQEAGDKPPKASLAEGGKQEIAIAPIVPSEPKPSTKEPSDQPKTASDQPSAKDSSALPQNDTKPQQIADNKPVDKTWSPKVPDLSPILGDKDPANIASFNGNKFGKPKVLKFSTEKDSTNTKRIKLVIVGENFIGKRAKIGKEKVVSSKKKSKGAPVLTFTEFKNQNILITRSTVGKQNTELVIDIEVPKDYKGGKETLLISTPVGQTFTEIIIP